MWACNTDRLVVVVMMIIMMVVVLNIEGGRTVSWVYIQRAGIIKLTYEGNA